MLSERASHRKILATRGADVYNGAKEKGGRGMGREFELKYRVSAQTLARIREELGEFEPIAMETVYYDTPDRILSARRWTLRQRMENGIRVCTLKTPASGNARQEWEVADAALAEALPRLAELSGNHLDFPHLQPLCGARFTRLRKLETCGGCTVEIALDQGVLTGGNRELPFAEVEVELKEGSEEAAARFAEGLAASYGLMPEKKSKFARAKALAEG